MHFVRVVVTDPLNSFQTFFRWKTNFCNSRRQICTQTLIWTKFPFEVPIVWIKKLLTNKPLVERRQNFDTKTLRSNDFQPIEEDLPFKKLFTNRRPNPRLDPQVPMSKQSNQMTNESFNCECWFFGRGKHVCVPILSRTLLFHLLWQFHSRIPGRSFFAHTHKHTVRPGEKIKSEIWFN